MWGGQGAPVIWCERLLRALFVRAVEGANVSALAAEARVSDAALRRQWRIRGWGVLVEREARLVALFPRRQAGECTKDLLAAPAP